REPSRARRARDCCLPATGTKGGAAARALLAVAWVDRGPDIERVARRDQPAETLALRNALADLLPRLAAVVAGIEVVSRPADLAVLAHARDQASAPDGELPESVSPVN